MKIYIAIISLLLLFKILLVMTAYTLYGLLIFIQSNGVVSFLIRISWVDESNSVDPVQLALDNTCES